MVRSGVISRTGKVRVIRDGTAVYTGNLASLKRFKDDVKEVREGLECGIGVENYNDLKVGDRIEAFKMEEIKRTLAPAGSAGAQ
jgi:translation initiation factor IF-2